MDASGATAMANSSYELLTGITGQPYRAVEYDYTQDGSFAYIEYARNGAGLVYALDNGDNSHAIFAMADKQTLQSIGNDIITGGGAQETFMFTRGFGQDEITDFSVAGRSHDIINLSSMHFSTLAQVLLHTTMSNGSAEIHLNPHDTIKLDGVNLAQLTTNPKDFVFS